LQGREKTTKRCEGIWYDPAVDPGMQTVVESPNLHRAGCESAEGGGEGWLPNGPVVGVGNDEDVGGQFGMVLLEQLGQGRGTNLLFPLDKNGDADGRLAIECP